MDNLGGRSLTTPDLLYSSAERWFKNNTANVVSVSYYTGPIGSAIASGFMGCDDSGHVVAIVSLDELQRDSVATVASDDVMVGCAHSAPKPLLVLSYRQRLDRGNVELIRQSMKPMKDNGWMCIVLDEQSRDGAQAFDVPCPTLDTLSTDAIIEMLEALKRVRDEQVVGGNGVESLD